MTEERGRGAEEGGHGPHGSSAPRADILAAPPPAPPPESRPTRARAGEAPGGDPAVAAALDYLRRGWAPIPYARGTKRPSGAGAEGWPSWRFTPEEIPEKFGGKNVGILLGAPSGGLVDVDLDCPEAERAADLLLPRTGAVFGRKSKPESHRLYVAEPVPTTAKYQDPTDGATLLELRGHTTDGKPGLQTMFPGSVHPSGEPVEWRWTAEPAPPKVAAGDLAGRVKSLAAVALLARHLPPPKEKRSKGTPGRDDYLFAIAGWLLRAGWDVAKVEACLYAVATAAAMESPKERSKKAGKAKAALAKGKKTRGWTWLVSHIGEEVMEKAREWLGVEERKVALKPEAPPPPRVVESLEETPPDLYIVATDTTGGEEGYKWAPEGIAHLKIRRHEKGKYERNETVIDGHVEPISRNIIDGETYYTVRLDREITATVPELVSVLEREGRVFSRGQAANALSVILARRTPRTIRAPAAVGVYADERGRLELHASPYPLTDSQRRVLEEIREKIGHEPTRGDLEAYAEFPSRYRPYEVLPAMGLSAIAPFAYELRRSGRPVPVLYHHSRKGSLGKSTVAEAYSARLYGAETTSADSIASDYRFAETADSCGLPLAVEEGEKLEEKRLGVHIKEAAERHIADRRGTADLGMRTYRSRAVIFVTGNAFPFKSESVLARILAPEFDANTKAERERKKKEFDAILARLKPVGWGLIRHAVREIVTVDELFRRYDAAARAIDVAYGRPWPDARRPKMWAAVLLGLRLWESYFSALGVEWRAPAPDAFVRDAVRPVEESTYETQEAHASTFRDWFLVWKSREDGVSGPGWWVANPEATKRAGWWVGSPVLAAYNRDSPPERRIASLNKLADMAAEEFRLDRGRFCGAGGRGARTEWLNDRPVKVAFVPDIDVNAECPPPPPIVEGALAALLALGWGGWTKKSGKTVRKGQKRSPDSEKILTTPPKREEGGGKEKIGIGRPQNGESYRLTAKNAPPPTSTEKSAWTWGKCPTPGHGEGYLYPSRSLGYPVCSRCDPAAAKAATEGRPP